MIVGFLVPPDDSVDTLRLHAILLQDLVHPFFDLHFPTPILDLLCYARWHIPPIFPHAQIEEDLATAGMLDKERKCGAIKFIITFNVGAHELLRGYAGDVRCRVDYGDFDGGVGGWNAEGWGGLGADERVKGGHRRIVGDGMELVMD